MQHEVFLHCAVLPRPVSEAFSAVPRPSFKKSRSATAFLSLRGVDWCGHTATVARTLNKLIPFRTWLQLCWVFNQNKTILTVAVVYFPGNSRANFTFSLRCKHTPLCRLHIWSPLRVASLHSAGSLLSNICDICIFLLIIYFFLSRTYIVLFEQPFLFALLFINKLQDRTAPGSINPFQQ